MVIRSFMFLPWLAAIFLLSSIPLGFGFKLSVPKVLLPYMISTPVNYTLEITGGGCTNWRSSRPEVATVIQPSKEVCSKNVIISAVSPHKQKMTAVISAEDPVTGNVLRCDVIVDAISEIEVITTTRELFLEDAPEMFSVQAKNDQGDTFSELGGLVFEWNLETDTEVDPESRIEASQVLRIIPFTNAKYESVAPIRTLESKGLQGHSILIEGVKSGSAFVSARLKDTPYEQIPSTRIGLVVIAHLMLNPSWDLYVPIFSTVHYKVELIRQTRAQEVKMPSTQYYLHLTNTSVGRLEEKTSDVIAISYGSTEIILKDRSIQMKNRQSIREATAGLHVVIPKYLGFKVNGGNNWVLQSGESYEISTEIFESAGRSLFLANNIRVEVQFPSEFFTVLKQTINGTHFNVKPIKRGTTNLDGELKAILKSDGEKFILPQPGVKGSQLVEIFDPVKVDPPLVVFLYDPRKSHYQFNMKATGGSGKYLWSSDNDKSAAIAERSGLLTGISLGSATISAVDIRNDHLKGTAIAHVVLPDKLSFIPHHVESEIGQLLRIPIEVTGKSSQGETKLKVTDCSLLDIDIQIKPVDGTLSFEYVGLEKNTDGTMKGCALVVVKPFKEGDSLVTATYKPLAKGSTDLHAEVLVSGYNPLTVISPAATPLVSIESSMRIETIGGPKPWKLDGSRYFIDSKLDSSYENMAAVVKTAKQHWFDLACLQVGMVELKLVAGNMPTLSNPFPMSSSTSVKIQCGFPASIEVTLVDSIKRKNVDLPPCPIRPSANIPVHNKELVELLVIAKDENGKKYDNITSLMFDWSIFAGSELGKLRQAEHQSSAAEVKLLGKSGLISIVCKLKEIRDLSCSGKKCGRPVEAVRSSSIDLQAVDYASLDKASLSIFNHPSNKVSLDIHKGSGHFYVAPTDELKKMARLKVVESTIEIYPTQSGSETVEIYDLCLSSATPLALKLFVSDLYKVDISGPNLVALGEKIRLVISAYDEKGVLLADEARQLITFTTETDKKGIVQATAEEIKGKTYLIVGSSVGTVSFSVSSVSPISEKAVVSQPHLIQVYKPLELSPKDLYLIVGAKFQIDIMGGPELHRNINFKLNQTGLATVSPSGTVSAETVGHVKVTGQIVVSHYETGEPTVLCEDSVIVHISKLSGIELLVGSVKVEVGTVVPLVVSGVGQNETPMSFGGMTEPLKWIWSVDNTDVATLQSVYHSDGYSLVSDSQISMRLFARKKGLVTVKVSLDTSTLGKSLLQKGAVVTDSIQILVVDGLMVTNLASFCPSLVLMTPHSVFQLKTNREAKTVTYQAVTIGTKDPTVTIDKNGLLTSNKFSGETIVIVTSRQKNSGQNETATILVEVRPIAYLMLNAKTPVKSTKPLPVLPVSLNLEISVSFHDHIGRQFNSVSNSVAYKLNTRDLVEMSSGNSSIHLKRNGETILAAELVGNPLIQDFILMPVGNVIEPTSEHNYLVGDVVCFNSPIESGTWSSDSAAILDIHSGVGVAVAKAPGVTTISLELGSQVKTKTEVTVSPAAQLSFTDRPYSYLSNVGQKTYRFHFALRSGANETNFRGDKDCLSSIRESISLGFSPLKSLAFRCHLEWINAKTTDIPSPLSLFAVTSEFDSEIAAYSCSVKKLPLENELDLFSRIDADIVVSVSKEMRNAKLLYDSFTLPFHPAYKVAQSELSLNNLQSSQALLSVTGSLKVLDHLTVVGNRKNMLIINGPETDSNEPYKRQYVVELDMESSAIWVEDTTDLGITVRCSLNDHEFLVPVKVKLYGQPPRGILSKTCPSGEGILAVLQHFWDGNYSVLMYLLTILITAVCVIIAYKYVLMGKGYASPTTSQTGVFASETPQADRNSPANVQWRSYGSPGRSPGATPYLWSLNSMQNDRSTPRTSSPVTSYNRSS